MLDHETALQRERIERNRVLDSRCHCKFLKDTGNAGPHVIVYNSNCPLNHDVLFRGLFHLHELNQRWPLQKESLEMRYPDGIPAALQAQTN